jgi:serine/threonine protein kinase
MSVEVDEQAFDPDTLIGQILASRYQIELRLGEGAMGAVYRAKHVKVGRPFAVKVLHSHLLVDQKVVQRFEREAELAGRLRHPNVIGVVDVGEMPDGTRYMVMDFAEGPDLATLLSEAPMPPQRIIHIVRQLLEGLYHAHEAGLIHRDFKPENVIVEKDSHGGEVPRIVDFGIAILREGGDSTSGPGRLTTNGLVLGTPHYMTPEQAVNDPIDHRINLFALGIMIYEMLCGKLPFDGNGAEVARANLMLDPPAIAVRVPYLEVDPLLEAYSRRLMAKSRDARPPTAKVARELLDLIDRDRDAAAAQLGVPLAVTRAPRTTEPVAPTRSIDDNYVGTFPPPIRAQVPPELARTELVTPAQGPPMAQAVARSDQRQITTDPTEPLPAPRRRRGVVIGAAAAGLVLVGVLAIELSSHEPPPKIVPPANMTEQPTPVPAPPPTPAPAPAPIAVDPTPVPAPPVVAKAPTPAPHPRSVAHHVDKAPVVTPANPSVGSAAAVATPVVNGPYDVNAFVAQLKSVGAELHKFAESHPDNSGDLQAKLTVLDVTAAYKSQAARDAARATLDHIHSEIARRSK